MLEDKNKLEKILKQFKKFKKGTVTHFKYPDELGEAELHELILHLQIAKRAGYIKQFWSNKIKGSIFEVYELYYSVNGSNIQKK